MILRAPHRLAAALCLLAASATVAADPPPVKVCVAVAGDPDESMRAGAESVSDAVAHHASLRGVADADARAALRGDTAPADFAALAAARRSLRGADADAPALDALSLRLGCGLVVELMARPAGTLVRVYDPVQHAWPSSRELATVDAATLDAVVVPALAARNAPAPATSDAGVAAASDAGAPATDGGAQPATTAASSAANRTAAGDRRAAPATRSPQRSAWSTAWPWVAVGGVALAVVGAYFLAQDGATTSTTRVTVVHPGVP